MHRATVRLLIAAATVTSLFFISAGRTGAVAFPTPIQHVVVILQENHSFDNVLGHLCITDHRDCDASLVGHRLDGSEVPLSTASDVVPVVGHGQTDQLRAMNKGAMNGFESVKGCAHDECYTAYTPEQIPSLAALSRSGAISDAFFSRDIVPSWGGHVDFFAQTLDGFRGNNPKVDKSVEAAPGWGCDSNKETQWKDPDTGAWVWEPSCIPAQDGSGPYRPSPVPYVPTIADRMDAAGRTWGIYGSVSPVKDHSGYRWAICPSFAECIYTPQRNNMHAAAQVLSDSKNGTLPNFSIIVPNGASGWTSQHNSDSMMVGDNWIGQVVSAIQSGPDGSSTTIFIYYDDCGCFYDHVAPPAGLGIRLPLTIVSPYAKPGYTDHTVATNSSVLAYAEHVLNVPPVNTWDGSAYAFDNSFDYTQTPTPPFVFHATAVPKSSLEYIAKHPAEDDDT